jgi:hypothetical protein
MKIIEAMKLIKELSQKRDDLVIKVKDHCADLDYQTPLYPDPNGQIQKWIQAHSDICKEILQLRTRIQKTNLATTVTIVLDGKEITKTIAEWIHRRKDLAGNELTIWSALNDRGLKEGMLPGPPGKEAVQVKIRRYFDPVQRDRKIELFRSEPGIIDRNLEVINAITDVIQ